MGIRRYKPTSAGRRNMSVSTFEEITTKKPEKSLLEPIRKRGGRKRAYRVIDFKRDKHGIPAKVATIEYDPNRSSRIALLHYRDGEKRYILAPNDLKVGQLVMSGEAAEPA